MTLINSLKVKKKNKNKNKIQIDILTLNKQYCSKVLQTVS